MGNKKDKEILIKRTLEWLLNKIESVPKQEYYQILRQSFCNNGSIHQKDIVILNVNIPNS